MLWVKTSLQKKISYNISNIKNTLLCKKQDADNYLNSEPLIRDLYHTYEQEKKASRCLDFDDLLIETVKLFEKKKFQF